MEDLSEDGTRSSTSDARPVVYLHIGAPKSGTTYLQNILWRNREALRADGVLYPGTTFPAHVHAAFDLRNTGFHGHQDPNVPGAWRRVVDEARAWNGTAVISQELFSPAKPAQIDRALSELSFAEVHLVYTARDLARQVPAAWQEDVKNWHMLGFTEFVQSLRDPVESRHALGTAFWRMQDAVEVLQRWGRSIPAERIHVVTVPPSGAPRGLLWDRFAGLIGLEPQRYDPTDAGPNLSLGAVEADLLRRINLALDPKIAWPTYARFIKHYVAQQVLAGRPDPLKIALSPDDHAWALDRSNELVAGLGSAGYDVVGDLDELLPSAAATTGVHPDRIEDGQVADIAVEAAAALVSRLDRLRAREARIEEREKAVASRSNAPVKQMVIDLSERYSLVMRAREVYWRAANGLRRLRTSGRNHGQDGQSRKQ